jgi:hypothetical protein
MVGIFLIAGYPERRDHPAEIGPMDKLRVERVVPVLAGWRARDKRGQEQKGN